MTHTPSEPIIPGPATPLERGSGAIMNRIDNLLAYVEMDPTQVVNHLPESFSDLAEHPIRVVAFNHDHLLVEREGKVFKVQAIEMIPAPPEPVECHCPPCSRHSRSL